MKHNHYYYYIYIYGHGLWLWSMSMVYVHCPGRVFSKRDRLYFLLFPFPSMFLSCSVVCPHGPPAAPARPAELLVQRRERETCFPPASFKLLGGGSQAECRPTPPCKPPDLPNDQPPAAVERHLLTPSPSVAPRVVEVLNGQPSGPPD